MGVTVRDGGSGGLGSGCLGGFSLIRITLAPSTIKENIFEKDKVYACPIL